MHPTVKGLFLELDGDHSIWVVTTPGMDAYGKQIVDAYQWDDLNDGALPARDWHAA